MDDAELVGLARRGDLAALARLVERHRPRLTAIGRGMLCDEEAAAEVVQETSLIALTALDRLRDPEQAGAWLAGITRNRCRRRLRSRYRDWSWDAVLGGRIPRDVVDPAPTPEEIVLRDEIAAGVVDAVDQLPSGQRDAVRLFHLDDLSHREVGHALGIDVNAVKARLHRARHSLRPLVATLSATPPRTRTEPTMTADDHIHVHIRDVRRRHADVQDQHVVIVASDAGDVIPIWIGPSEAIGLALRLTATAPPRPLTHDAMAALVRATDGRVAEVRLTRLQDVTFYAEAVVESSAGTNLVDMRPSDAFNLALAADVPIRCARDLLDQVAPAAGSPGYTDDDFPDDASVIASDIVRQWTQALEEFKHQRGSTSLRM